MVKLVNPITDFRIYYVGCISDFAGWIALLNGNQVAGYVYLSNKAQGPRLGGFGKYIVMSRPVAEFPFLFALLGSGRNMQITYHGDDAEGKNAIAFLEDVDGVNTPEDMRARMKDMSPGRSNRSSQRASRPSRK